MQISISKTDTRKPRPNDEDLAFGNIFTDHMFNMDYDPENGWHNPRIEPYQPIQMDPSTMVLHYGQAIFEGLKAYRTEDDTIQLFRPRENFKRLNRSAHTMCIPEFDEELALEGLKKLLEVEKKLVKFIPKEFMVDAHHWLILLGRYTCVARKPRCGSCLIEDLCEFKDKTE